MTAPGRRPQEPRVRQQGPATSHLVRHGRSGRRQFHRHWHLDFATEDGARVLVTWHGGDTSTTRRTVVWWDADGRRHEVQTPGTARWALVFAGFDPDPPVTPERREAAIRSLLETTSPDRPPAHPEGPPA